MPTNELLAEIEWLRERLKVADKNYEAAVTGRRDFRELYRKERERSKQLRLLLAEARERICKWTTGVNDDILTAIDEALLEKDPSAPEAGQTRGEEDV